MIDDLFIKAKPKATRLKMYIYGKPGTGKTVTSLQFPDPAVVDTQKGVIHYREDFDFHEFNVEDPSDPSAIEMAVDQLIEEPGPFKTFVIDSMTDVWDRMVQKRIRYKRDKENDPHYELQPGDWGYLKNRIKYFIQKLLSLDMNIIATAESKKEYDNSTDDDTLKVIGTKPDGHKKIPHIFDVVIELTADNEGHHWAHVKKDRTNTLPKNFEFTYAAFAKHVGIEGLERIADVDLQKHEYSDTPDRTTEITYEGDAIRTAGIQANQLTEIENIMETVGEKKIREVLQNDYFVDSLLDLRRDEAELLIRDITNNQ